MNSSAVKLDSSSGRKDYSQGMSQRPGFDGEGDGGHGAKSSLGEHLFNRLHGLFSEHPSLGVVDQLAGNNQKLRILCFQVCENPTLASALQPESDAPFTIPDQSLLSGWLAYIVADQLKLSVSSTADVFNAGLVQTLSPQNELSQRAFIGEHVPDVDSSIIDSSTIDIHQLDIDDLELAEDASHQQDAVKHLLLSSMSANVQGLVAEQYERYDGSGLPAGKYESQLSMASQVLIVVNEVVSILYDHLDTSWLLSFASVLPILKLNASLYFREVYNKTVAIISAGEALRDSVERRSSIKALDASQVASIIELHRSLAIRWPSMLRVRAELSIIEQNTLPPMLLSSAQRAWLLVTTSGILSNDLIKWVSTLSEADGESRQAVWELEVLLNELNHIIVQCHRCLDALLTTGLATELTTGSYTIDSTHHARLSDLCEQLRGADAIVDDDQFTLIQLCE